MSLVEINYIIIHFLKHESLIQKFQSEFSEVEQQKYLSRNIITILLPIAPKQSKCLKIRNSLNQLDYSFTMKEINYEKNII